MREQLSGRGITPAVIADTIAAAPCVWIAAVDGEAAGFAMAEAFLFASHDTLWLETGAASRAFGFYRKAGRVPVSEAGEGDMRLEKRRT